MSRRSPFVIALSDADRAVLEQRARAYTAPFAEVVRAKIVLLAAAGEQNAAIAERLDVNVDVVSRWRKRFFEQGLDGLRDRKRSGRPRSFPAEVVAEVKARQRDTLGRQRVGSEADASIPGGGEPDARWPRARGQAR